MSRRFDRTLELVTVWILLASGLGLTATCLGWFQPFPIVFLALLGTSGYAYRTRNTALKTGPVPNGWHVLVLVALALALRLPAYNHVLGGQDEGVYVNIAHHVLRTGTLEVRDPTLERLRGTGFEGIYLQDNESNGYLPGVYELQGQGHRLEFQFYDLFPVWMALSGGLFGSGSFLWALTFFSILSILFFYRLALQLTGSQQIAFLAGLLLAVCPLHVFFSKFPVTEVMALTFSLMALHYLALNRASAGQSTRFAVISALCLGGLFVTRISGFMYMPFVLAGSAVSAIMDVDLAQRRGMLHWAALVMALYVASVLYGLRWSGVYSQAIYRLSFERIFGESWRLGVLVACAILLAGWLTLILASRNIAMRTWIRSHVVSRLGKSVSLIFALGVTVGLVRIYQLGWTHRFDADPWLGQTWHLSGTRWNALKSSSLFAFFAYLGPFIPVLFFLFALKPQKRESAESIRIFAVAFVVYMLTLQWALPYGPYYARYLLSAGVPYAVLFVCLVVGGMGSRRVRSVMIGLLVLSACYMFGASAAQFKMGRLKPDGMAHALKKLLAPVDSSDLVLLYKPQRGLPTLEEIKTPMIYVYGRQVDTIDSNALSNHAYIAALDAAYDDVFLITPSATIPRGFVSEGSTRIRDWAFAPTHVFPHRLTLRGERTLYTYRLVRPVIPLDSRLSLALGSPWSSWLSRGWQESEQWGTWSRGKHAELTIDPRQFPDQAEDFTLRLDGRCLVTHDHPRQRITVLIGGAVVANKTCLYPASSFRIDFPLSRSLINESKRIEIKFDLPDAVAPNRIGLNGDSRMLAIGLRYISVLRASREKPSK